MGKCSGFICILPHNSLLQPASLIIKREHKYLHTDRCRTKKKTFFLDYDLTSGCRSSWPSLSSVLYILPPQSFFFQGEGDPVFCLRIPPSMGALLLQFSELSNLQMQCNLCKIHMDVMNLSEGSIYQTVVQHSPHVYIWPCLFL